MRLLRYFIKNKSTFTNAALINNANKLKPPWNVLFFGSDNFSLPSLQALNTTYCRLPTLISKLEVVTNLKNTFVRNYAKEHSLKVHDWPFIKENHDFHVGVIVSFGHLIPGKLIDSFPMGMLNVHASLLPKWRGAAPIIYAIANGDMKTGVTVMEIKADRFDVGNILSQREVDISRNTLMPDLYDTLAFIGAETLIVALGQLPDILINAKPQDSNKVTYAPRISSSFANVDLAVKSAEEVFNLYRALYKLYPISIVWNSIVVKLHEIKGYKNIEARNKSGFICFNKSENVLELYCKNGCVLVEKIGVKNKKVMTAREFNNGFLKKFKKPD